jgi:chromate transporter
MVDASAAATAAPGEQRRGPASLSDLFVSTTFIALQGFGGVLAVVQRELVDRHQWLTREEFIEEWAVAQIMPGPNVVNLALMIGHRYFGLRGALVAVCGMLAVPLVVILLLAFLYSRFGANPHIAGALRGMGAVAAGLITATGLKLASALGKHPVGLALVALFGISTFIGIAILRLPLVWVLLAVGGLSCTVTWFKVGTLSRP